jgi:hypothetical protein
VKAEIEALLEEGKFLLNGLDEQVSFLLKH